MPSPAGLPGPLVEARKVASGAAGRDFTYAVIDLSPRCQAADRRRFARQKVRLRSGKIIRPDGQFLCECLVQNRSSAGGRLKLQTAAALPDAVLFYDDQSEQLFHATVVWRRDREVGLRLQPCAPTGPHRAVAARMRRKFYTLRR
ncbi:MAG: hypothetical protein INR70_40390 [Parafilimonas terrae]|nr:hypothetical protein [Parafilimonas terrae]